MGNGFLLNLCTKTKLRALNIKFLSVQPMGNLPCNVTSHTAGASNRSNCISRVPASCQDQVSPGNRGLCNQLLMQPILPTAGWEQVHTPNLAGTALPQSANSSFQESSNLRYASVDPLQDELVRLKNEVAEADKIHKDKVFESLILEKTLILARNPQFMHLHLNRRHFCYSPVKKRFKRFTGSMIYCSAKQRMH